MRHAITATNTGRRVLPVLSLLLGVALLAHTSDLQYEFFVSTPIKARALPAMVCPIPANAVAPDVKALAKDISRRFHLAEGAAVSITHAAFDAARVRGIDPTLVLAVAAVESRFKPGAVNPATGAKGLMQVLPMWHRDRVLDVGGESSLMLISPNINVGAAILAEYLEAGGGNLDVALSRYLGSAGQVHYGKLVRVEMAHLSRVLDAL